MDTSTLIRLEREALMLRNEAALRLLRTDPELTPEEALLMVVAPSASLRRASLRAAADAEAALAREQGCRRCHAEVDEDGFCGTCAAVTLDAAVLA